MDIHEFSCPSCAARLRVRDRSYAGRTVNCPDCTKPILVKASVDGTLHGVAVVEKSSPGKAGEPAASAKKPDASVTSKRSPPTAATNIPARPKRRVGSPAAIGWIVAALVFGAALFVVFRGTGVDSPAGGEGDERSVDSGFESDGVKPQRPAVVDPREGELIEARLAELGRSIADYREQFGQFPGAPSENPALPRGERFGWIAALVAESDPDGAQPLWDRGWSDPLNDRFVRQRIDMLLNPSTGQLVGGAGYPATNFAGVAGVGADAASLPVDHPRAGIFGWNRTARAEDVTDGLSSTMMVAGVQTDVASWASGGRGTIRPFVEEPYINGPDGFGTGQGDGMFVLMADGSVRFLSEDIDPLLMRRMAAMADGFPLDAAVPGEPGEKSEEPVPVADAMPAEDEVQVAADEEEADDRPIEVEMAPDEPLFDVDAALRQRIVEFQQESPVPAAALLLQVEEMAGVPIDAGRVFEAGQADLLEQPVSVSLVDTTVQGILVAVLDQAGLGYVTGPGGILLTVEDESESP